MKALFNIILKLISVGFIFVVSMGIGLALYASTLLSQLPTVEQIRYIPLSFPLRIYSSDQKLIAEYGNERRIPITLDETPTLMIDAILATEDDQFYYHTGVDFPGLVRAALSNFRAQSKAQGASTITMQVARNFFLNPEKTYERKLKEILLAFNMERALTKDEILELYLNKIFLGHRAYGFAAAAQVYYGEELGNLSLPEVAMLAGLPKAPSRDNPLSNPERAKERRGYVLKRMYELGKIDRLSYETASNAPITASRHIANIDLDAPYISEMARQIMLERFGDAIYERGFNVYVTVNSEYQQRAEQALRKGLLEYDVRHGFRGPIGHISLGEIPVEERESLVVEQLASYPVSRELVPAVVLGMPDNTISALNLRGEEVVVPWEHIQWAREYISANAMGPELGSVKQILKVGDVVHLRQLDEENWALSQLPDVSGALVSLDPNSGAIFSITGGFDYFLSKFNRATQARRQPGSNIKPFIYSAALANGFTPSSMVSAAPIVIQDDLEGVWRPQNYSKKFFGPTRLRQALSLSLNLVSVRLLRAMGIENTIDHLAGFGFDPDRLPPNLSLALGSTQVTPLEMATSFAAFANGGRNIKPYLIETIIDADGFEVELPSKPCVDCINQPEEDDSAGDALTPADIAKIEFQTKPVLDITAGLELSQLERQIPERAISPQNAFLMQDMLKQVITSGTGRRALVLERGDIAGKTGTTNDFRDAWFSGFNPDVMTTVFVGFDEPAHLGRREAGGAAALPIWIDYMERVLQDFPEQEELIPDNIVTRFINKDSGELTYSEDPEGYDEYYVSGSEPTNLVQTPGETTAAKQDESVTETLF